MKNSKRTFQLKKKVLDFFTSIFIRLRAVLTFQFWNYPLYGLGLFFVLWVSYSMGGVVLSEGQIAPKDIFVRKTIEIVDVKATEERKNALLAELVPIFRIDESFTQELKKEYTTFFQELEAIRNTVTTPSISFERKEEFFREWKITPGVFEWFIETNPEKYERIKEVFFLNMEKNLGQPILEGDVEQKILESYSAYERMNLEVDEIRVLNLLTSRFLKPNARIDITETEKQRELVIKNIEPVKRYIQKGQILVKKGTIVTHTDLESLRALGLVGEQYESYLLVALGILIVFTLVFEYSFIKKFIAEIIQRNSLLLIRILTAIGVIALNALSLRFSWYLILLAAVPFILYTLMGRNLALCESLILFPLLMWGERADFMRSFYIFMNLFLPLFLLDKTIKRRDLVKTGFWIALANILMVIIFGLQEGNAPLEFLVNSVYGFGGAIIASIAALGGISLFETTFHVATDFRLLELVNPTHPLLKRLMMEAPGTYSHSLMMANLAEAAADAIGANPLLARAGAYYHDIGKIKRPYFFIENQMSENIHNRLSPHLSTLVIQNHLKDGLEIARKYHLPVEIQNIIQSHHGNTVMRYFYDKAIKQKKDDVTDTEFRYPGPLPKTQEEVLIFLADSVEAAIRSANNLNSSRLEAIVNGIVQNYLKDGQLDDSPLTMRDIHKISDAFVMILSGMFHARVPYPENTVNGEDKGSKGD